MPAPLNFFFYGTLIAGSNNAAARAAHARLRPIGPATVAGALWAIPDSAGWYPALISGRGPVHGILYAADDGFGPTDLAQIDEWEDYHPKQLAELLYLREEEQVTDAGGGSIAAQLYRFSQPLPKGAVMIPGGDFPAWLTAHGYAAYAG